MGYIKVLILGMVSICLAISCSKIDVAPLDNDQSIEIKQEVPPLIPPKRSKVKALDPLEGKTFTFSARSVAVQTVLYTISIDAGLNLVINPDVDVAENAITANFVNTPIRDALEIVMDMSNLFYEVRGNVLRIYKYDTVNFNIPYLTVTGNQKTSLGGDAVGAADTEGATNLKGEFTLDFSTKEEDNNFYTQLEANINNILQDGDKATINRLTGIVSVYATHNTINRISRLIDNIVENSVRQVQIEARVVEVTLRDEFSYGINWAKTFKEGNFKFGPSPIEIPNGIEASIGIGSSFTSIFKALSVYGHLNTLSNPRITLLSGQSAMISAGTILPYWDRTIETTVEDGVIRRSVSVNRYNVMDGMMLGVTAFIHDDGTVMMNVTPIVTSVLSDKAEAKDNDTVIAEAPKIAIKEMGTTVQVEDGGLLVIGGLISNTKEKNTSSVPLLGSIPILGYLFSYDSIVTTKKELVVFIRPIVVKSNSKVVRK